MYINMFMFFTVSPLVSIVYIMTHYTIPSPYYGAGHTLMYNLSALCVTNLCSDKYVLSITVMVYPPFLYIRNIVSFTCTMIYYKIKKETWKLNYYL